MPEGESGERTREQSRKGKSPSTQAGEFVREEMRHIREGKHGARSTKQAIAIGLSKARRAGVNLPAPTRGKTSERTRAAAARAYKAGQQSPRHKPSTTRSRAILVALQREGHAAASPASLARHARAAAIVRRLRRSAPKVRKVCGGRRARLPGRG